MSYVEVLDRDIPTTGELIDRVLMALLLCGEEEDDPAVRYTPSDINQKIEESLDCESDGLFASRPKKLAGWLVEQLLMEAWRNPVAIEHPENWSNFKFICNKKGWRLLEKKS